MTAPRIVLWDIETTQNLVALFQLKYNDYVDPQNILRERYIVCAAWKVLGEKRIHSVSVTDDLARYAKNPHDDAHVVKTLHDVLSSADVIVAHNGDSYDTKFFTGRAIVHGLPKLPPIKSVDTKKVAASQFLFNSNKLDYLGQYLGVGKKLPHTTGLWLRVLAGDARAILEMVRYNKQDVALLERVFLRLLPYVTESINRHLYGTSELACPRCGSHKVQSRGTHKALTRAYQRYHCQNCGGWFRNNVILDRTTTRLIA